MVTTTGKLRELPRRERLWAALQRQTAGNKQRRVLHRACGVKLRLARGEAVPLRERIPAEIVTALQRTFHMLTPSQARIANPSMCAPRLPAAVRLPASLHIST